MPVCQFYTIVVTRAVVIGCSEVALKVDLSVVMAKKTESDSR